MMNTALLINGINVLGKAIDLANNIITYKKYKHHHNSYSNNYPNYSNSSYDNEIKSIIMDTITNKKDELIDPLE